MAIYLPGAAEDQELALEDLTPREIVAELDKYVVGQHAAKRAVAIALRNRMRRQKLAPDLAEEIMPKNIIMIGPTGVGKTEIARRLAKLTNSPFLKVEASKFTEVGYVGRDVESIVRDLVEISIDMVREEKLEEVEDKAEMNAEERLLDLLLPPPRACFCSLAACVDASVNRRLRQDAARRPATNLTTAPAKSCASSSAKASWTSARSKSTCASGIRRRLKSSPTRASRRWTSISRTSCPTSSASAPRSASMKVAEAFEYLIQEEEQPPDRHGPGHAHRRSSASENSGIVFLDEIDKIAGREGGHGPDVSREGVQRDILPIVEGTTVNTRYGMVRTDHILFIAAGAFHVSKPSDLIPELQGRFPIRVELQSLTVEDFIRILTEPKSSLVKQYTALLDTEGLKLEFTPRSARRDGAASLSASTRRQRTSAHAACTPSWSGCSTRSAFLRPTSSRRAKARAAM